MVEAILFLQPQARSLVDFTVHDDSDGAGPFIAHWNTKVLGPQPTSQDLAAVEASTAYQDYLSTREKNAQVADAKATLGPKDIAVLRASYKAAGLPVPDDATLTAQIVVEIDAQKP